MAIVVLPTSAQITFKLKSVVGQQNPSSNGLFSYGTLNNGTFQLFPHYGEDGTGDINGISQKGWTFVLGQENYPFLAFEQLNAGEVTPQPFPPFGIFMHPSNDAPSVVKLSIPNNATIISITNNVQRPSFGCGDNIGYSIITDNSTILARTIISTSSSPNVYMVGAMPINAGNNIYFIVDKGDDGNYSCDDTALDVEITLQYDKIVTPTLSGTLNCNATSATFDIAFQPSGTLELYKLGNPSPIASTTISQVGNSFNGQGTFSGLDFSAGGSYYVIAKNNEQEQSDQSAVINVSPCCTNAIAPSIMVNNLSLCQGEIGTLSATGCTNGTITWSNGVVGTSTTVNASGTYTATCKVLATPPCLDATSTASGVVTVNALPTLTIDGTTCSADLLTYKVNFSGNGVISSTAGIVSGNSVINIPAGLDVQLTATNSAGCTITKTVNSPNCICPIIDAPISGGNKTICQGQIIPSLTVSVGENTNADWYDANVKLVASSTLNYTPTTSGTYYVQARNLQNNCVSATRTPVSLSVNALPILSAGTPTCSADLLTYSLSFTSDGIVTSSAGIVSNNIVSGIPTGTNVVLTATSNVGCVATQTVNAPSCTCPTVNLPISGGDKTICAGQAIPTLSVSVGSNEVAEWFDAPNGGKLLATGLSYTPNVAIGMTFYVQSKNTITNCVSATRTPVSLSINALPTLSVGTPTCSADLLTYSVSFTSDGIVTSSAGIVSNNIISGIPTGTNIVLTATSSVGCIATQTVNAPSCFCPTVNLPISGGDKTICGGQAIPTLSVSVGSNEVAEWYDAPNGGKLLATGVSYTPNVAIGMTFYVQSKNTITNCVSATRTPVSLSVNALPTLSVGTPTCSADLLTYSISFTSNDIVASSAGIVSNNIVSGIPTGTNIVITATSSAGCIATQTVNSPACICPTVNLPISGGDRTICAGQAIPTLSVSVGSNEVAEWYDAPIGGNLLATGVNYTPNIAIGMTFYVQSKNTITNCVSATRIPVSLSVNALPTLSVGTPTCSADLLTYSVSFTGNGVITSSAGIVSNNIVLGIPTGTNVVLTATSSAGCIDTQTVNSPACTCPTVNLPISGGDKTICAGQAIPTLSVSVGSNEIAEWYDSASGGNLLATGLSFTPNSETSNNGLFYVQARNATNNCTSNARILVKLIVNSSGTTPKIVASKNPLVLGETATLSISNCNGIVSWNTGESTLSISSVTPKVTTEYSATCTASGGCVGGNGKIIIEVTAPKITVKASPNVVCMGGSTTLSMSGCPSNTVYWTSPEFGRRDEVSPVFNGIVQAVSFTGHCVTSAGEATETIGVNIRQPKDFQITSSKNPVILGESTVLSTTGCDGVVSWQNGQAVGNPITVWPTNKYTEYVAECLSPNACGGKGKITIEVKPPVIKATGKDVCWGLTATLGQSGCSSSFYWVVWHNDDFMDAKPIDNPNSYPITQKTNFRVMCSTPVGEGAGDITINPIPLPNKPDIGSERTTYFLGETVRIGTGGCNGSVRWSTGENDVNIIEVKPRHTTKYTVTCVGGYGCTNSNEIEITMITPPPTAKDQTICYGDTVKLVSGCMAGTEVHWTKNWMDIPNRVEVPEGFQERLTASNTYAVSCYSHETGWSEAIAIKVTVKAKITPPTITVRGVEKTAIIVKGETIELLANACNRTEWKAGSVLMADTLNEIQVKPLQTTTYHARCFVDGCYSEWSQFKVYVRPKMPVISESSDTLCVGSSTIITAKNCEDGGTLVWLDDRNFKDLSFAVSPKSDITYKAICVGLDSLVSDTTTTFIKVYQTPQKPVITGNLIILDGEKTTLTASGCDENLLWNTGEKSQSIVVRPEKNTVYSATCGIWQCISDTASVKVRVRPRPIEIETSNSIRGYSITDTLCLNKQLTVSTLTQCNGTIVWSNGQSGEKIEVIGTRVETQKYSLYCINADNEKSDESTATITVLDYNINEAIAYPNPTSGKLYIKSKGCIDGVKLILYSQRGEILYEGGGQERYLDSIVLDLFNLPSETYILYIVGTDGNKPVTLKKRIVKVNN